MTPTPMASHALGLQPLQVRRVRLRERVVPADRRPHIIGHQEEDCAAGAQNQCASCETVSRRSR
jgi:hypothetical protein